MKDKTSIIINSVMLVIVLFIIFILMGVFGG